MNCNDIRPLLEARSDGELDLVRQLELEAVSYTHLDVYKRQMLATGPPALGPPMRSPIRRKHVSSMQTGTPRRRSIHWSARASRLGLFKGRGRFGGI